jgi:hypothetical protein
MEQTITCTSCGKQTFKRKYCMFCGHNLSVTESQPKKAKKETQTTFDIQIKDFENQINELKDLVEKTKKTWKELEINFKEKLSQLENNLKISQNKKNELNVLLGLEEITEEEFKEETKMLDEQIHATKKESDNLTAQRNKLSKLFKEIPKTKKKTKVNKKEISKKLKKLEEAYKNATISKELYIKLKEKYQNQLKDE